MDERSADRGSAAPETPAEPPVLTDLDEELVAEGAGVPHADARDVGDPGGPSAALGVSGETAPLREGRQSEARPDLSPPFDEDQR